ncbi:putative aspartic proteinase nepenthesin-2-like [Capsicum annuum]|nr:putative aspartic proteinase nepenthesin-2-like [Capsicum annuum]
MSGNMATQSSIPDLNETLNESDRSLTLCEMNNDEFFGWDYNYGQSSQLELMDNARTSSNIPLSLNFDAIDYYRDNIMRDQHVVPEDIENGDQVNYGELSQSDDSEPNNTDEGPDVFVDMHENVFVPAGFVDEWRFEHHEGVNERIFNYVFWTFKPCVDGFRYCRPVILIHGTHVYGKYDIKLLIAVGTDGNGSIFPLAFAISTNESLDTWTKFLSDLHQHVVRGRQGITLISDRHHDILKSVSTGHNWQAPFAYHHYCLRHLKANYQRAYKSVRLNNLLWAIATATQEKKFLLQMKLIKETHFPAYEWLMNIDLEKWTMHKDEQKEQYLFQHGDKIAMAFGLISTAEQKPIRILKNLRVCGNCHKTMKFISVSEGREIIFRDSNRFHHIDHVEKSRMKPYYLHIHFSFLFCKHQLVSCID